MPRRKTDTPHMLPPSGTNTKWRVRVQVKDPKVRAHLRAPYTGRDAMVAPTGQTDKKLAYIVALPIIDGFLRIKMEAEHRAYPRIDALVAATEAAHKVAAERAWQALQPRPDPAYFVSLFPDRAPTPIVDVTPEPVKRCALDTALDTWEIHRYDIKKKAVREQQKRTARRAKELVFEKLFAWGTKRGKPDPTDMASYTNDEMTTYQVHLAKLGGSIAFDHWSHIAALFGRAKQYKLVDVDPTEGIEQPSRVQKVEPPFSPDEQRRILRAALRSPKPTVKFGTLLSKFTGANNSECFEAQADEFIYVNGVLCWDLRGRVLKDSGAGTRGRLTPIHSAILAAGFEEYLATRKGKKLFDGSPNVHSADCNALVHNPDEGPRIDKVFKSWRKSFTDPITRLSGRLLGNTMIGEYLSGHRPAGIHASFYMFHTEPEGFADLVKVVSALDDPLGEMAVAAD